MIVDYVGQEEEYPPRLNAHFDVVLKVAAGRAESIRLHRAGEIDEDTLHELEHDLDLEELSAISATSQYKVSALLGKPGIHLLFVLGLSSFSQLQHDGRGHGEQHLVIGP